MVYSSTEVLDIEAFIERGLLGAQSALSFCFSQCQESDEGFQGHFVFFGVFIVYLIKIDCGSRMFSMALIFNAGPVCVYKQLRDVLRNGFVC